MDLGKRQVQAALAGKLDATTFDAKLGVTQFSPAALTFDIALESAGALTFTPT